LLLELCYFIQQVWAKNYEKFPNKNKKKKKLYCVFICKYIIQYVEESLEYKVYNMFDIIFNFDKYNMFDMTIGMFQYSDSALFCKPIIVLLMNCNYLFIHIIHVITCLSSGPFSVYHMIHAWLLILQCRVISFLATFTI